MRFFLLILAVAVPAYVLGSVNGAIITSKYLYRKDIRKFGSGNPGLTNFYRVFGKGGALLVVAIDMFKTIAPVIFGGWLMARFSDTTLSQVWLFDWLFEVSLFGQAISGLFVVLGHCFPVFYRFMGGKGVMAVGAIVIVLDWRLAIISWGIFILLTALTRYVSLGAMTGAAAFPIAQFLIGIGGYWELLATSLCAILLIARHHQNIRRLVKGEESRFSFQRKKNKFERAQTGIRNRKLRVQSKLER
jgi:glycerol-3-phosphate acyltransferase PlsY